MSRIVRHYHYSRYHHIHAQQKGLCTVMPSNQGCIECENSEMIFDNHQAKCRQCGLVIPIEQYWDFIEKKRWVKENEKAR